MEGRNIGRFPTFVDLSVAEYLSILRIDDGLWQQLCFGFDRQQTEEAAYNQNSVHLRLLPHLSAFVDDFR